jgi:2-hydroxychromene-2-carboxylate isomerase
MDGPRWLQAAGSAEAMAEYAASTDEAIARNVPGSPTYFVDGDMFYGQDRLELVARAMEQAFKDTWPEITE